ncbi:hypothetical protein [Desulfogranum japonicum]|uniref:hypothetical protein n=1 Tax=Desulfogranum japonicum TaxID=231447 RepID=UPI0004266272|nr:hypothetical protein [Desulfogranum japonicum]
MEITLTIVNKDVNLQSQQILAYLKPQGSNSDWLIAAWQSCAPQAGGGKFILPAINNTVSAYGIFNGDKETTRAVTIPLQNMSVFSVSGNVTQLGVPTPDTVNLTPQQSGVRNDTSVGDLYPVWCLNGNSVCKPSSPMFNSGMSSFELTQKIYLTIGSQTKTKTFIVQNWTDLQGIDLDANLKSADIEVQIDKATNRPIFKMTNEKY